MSMVTRAEAAAFLEGRDHFALVTHCRPDGDTLGSAAALCRGLRQMGKTAHMLRNPETTPRYAYLTRGLTKETAAPGDTVISVDVASPQLIMRGVAAEDIALRIDHHETVTSFAKDELVDPDAAACGEIIYDILMMMHVTVDREIANALYTAVSTDTGCFRFANTRSRTFDVASCCAAASPDLPRLNGLLFDTNTLARLRIRGWVVENARFFEDGKICVVAIPLSVEQAFGVTEDDMENISGLPRSIEGVKLAATLRQCKDGACKLSVRAVPGYDAAAVCEKLGGGGHVGAAGATLRMTMDDAVEAVLHAMTETV